MDILASTLVVPLASNFLVPNATFIAEVIAFAIIIWVLAKYIIPPINAAMTSRQEAIRKQFTDLEEAESDARKAEADYKEQLNNAKHEAARIREEAREQGAQIVQEAREKAQGEADRIVEHAHAQIEAAWRPCWRAASSASPWTTTSGRVAWSSASSPSSRPSRRRAERPDAGHARNAVAGIVGGVADRDPRRAGHGAGGRCRRCRGRRGPVRGRRSPAWAAGASAGRHRPPDRR
jgi:F-type H+-transporting ATPase subunit b